MNGFLCWSVIVAYPLVITYSVNEIFIITPSIYKYYLETFIVWLNDHENIICSFIESTLFYYSSDNVVRCFIIHSLASVCNNEGDIPEVRLLNSYTGNHNPHPKMTYSAPIFKHQAYRWHCQHCVVEEVICFAASLLCSSIRTWFNTLLNFLSCDIHPQKQTGYKFK